MAHKMEMFFFLKIVKQYRQNQRYFIKYTEEHIDKILKQNLEIRIFMTGNYQFNSKDFVYILVFQLVYLSLFSVFG